VSGHHYKIAYWEALNEIEFEHHWTPAQYTKFYDVVTAAMRKVDPDIKFVALALGAPSNDPTMFQYFLNHANHRKDAPLDFISYHFYATPTPEQTVDNWQYTFFDQAAGFLNTVHFVEQMRKQYSPETKTDLDELGVILPEDGKSEPKIYWNAAAAMYAYLYVETARLGIDVVGESQLVGYPSQYPSVSMMNYVTTEPNARFWVLKLLKDNFGPGDRLIETTGVIQNFSVQAFETKQGKTLLAINKRNRVGQLLLPEEMNGASVSLVAPSTGDHPAAQEKLQGRILVMQPFEVAVVQSR
jgi:Glycosyl hydrolases family 39